MKHRFWLVCHPDIDKPIGGVKQLHRLAECLQSLGFVATLIQGNSAFRPKWFDSNVKTVAFKDFSRSATISPDQDIFILPETYISAFPTYSPGFKKIIFNQNFSYTFRGADGCTLNLDLVRKYYNDKEILGVLCVSEYDEKSIAALLGFSKPVLCISNAIEGDLFMPEAIKYKLLLYMPRKNQPDSSIVTSSLRLSQAFDGWKLQPIHGLTSTEVAAFMKKAALFLSFGHPEGFGLPVAEALACGCAVIGYSGLGGRELFALAGCYGTGEEIEFGDLMAFEPAFRRINQQIVEDKSDFSRRAHKVSQIIRATYSFEQMCSTVLNALRVMGLAP